MALAWYIFWTNLTVQFVKIICFISKAAFGCLPIFSVVNENSQIEEEHQKKWDGSRRHQPEPEGVGLDVCLVLPDLGVDESHKLALSISLGLDLKEPGNVNPY